MALFQPYNRLKNTLRHNKFISNLTTDYRIHYDTTGSFLQYTRPIHGASCQINIITKTYINKRQMISILTRLELDVISD
jgi:hypothetical protein